MREEVAVALFRKGYNCTQSVFTAFTDITGVDEERSKATALGFGGGVGGLQQLCGAVSGGVMALGAVYFDEADVRKAKKDTYDRVKRFVERFEAEYGSTDCIRLLGADFSDPEMSRFVREKNMFSTKCEKFIVSACRLLETMIEEEKASAG